MANLNLRKRMAHWRSIAACMAAMLAFLAAMTLPAKARGYYYGHHRHAVHYHSAQYRVFHHRAARHAYFRRQGRPPMAASAESDEAGMIGGHSGFAAIVVDGASGRTLFSRNENELRHPASVTKVMTLYLLFEQLERGRLRLDSPLMISAHAASRAPSKLGLAPGETIDVENAIKALVTKSANDIASAIAENIAGDEDTFARMMTRKAHALGMTRTHYANASGLPHSEQITTARDLAILGRAIQDRFPRYYRYFSTHSFAYHGALHRNHNHLLGRIEGVDGIKTGYTRASGFNLLSSVRRGGRHIVAVVLGGRSAGTRDRIMAGLIEENINGGGRTRFARAATVEAPAERAPEPMAVAEREYPVNEPPFEEWEEEPAAPAPVRARVPAPIAPVALLTPPASIPAARETTERARPAYVPGVQKRAEAPIERKGKGARKQEEARAATDGSTSRAANRVQTREASAATTPSTLKRADNNRTLLAKADAARPAKPGWMIQIGATEDVDEAAQLLSRARGQMHGAAATARAFTEKVQKGKETLWRARFAGLEEQSAESACRALKRSGFACFTTRN